MKKDGILEVYDTECFNLILEVKEHSISTTELIKYLSGTSDLFKTLNHSLNRYYSCGYDQILIDIEALEKGSFKINARIKKMARHPLFVAGVTVVATHLLSGNQGETTVYNINNGTVINIQGSELMQNKDLVKAISSIAETTVNSKEVAALTLEYTDEKKQLQRRTLENDILRTLVVEDIDENDRENHLLSNARLIVVSPVLDSTPAYWKVKLNDRTFSARMTDEEFLNRMDKEKIAFAKNDILIADIETIIMEKANGVPDVKHYIRKVHQYPKYTVSQKVQQKDLF